MNKWIAEFDLEDGDTMPEHMDLEYKGVKLDFHCRPLEQEPRKGNWVEHSTYNNKYYYDCSLCGCVAPRIETADTYLWKLSNFCPDCGADMRGEEC